MEAANLGIHFMLGFSGTEPQEQAFELIEKLQPAGVALFSRNVESPLQVAALTNSIQRFAWERLGRGMLIAVDQEGGRVNRLRNGFTVFPAPWDLASEGDPQGAVSRAARVTARELRLVGINVDFVPCLDVLSTDGDVRKTVIGDRSLGTDPARVGELGLAVIAAFRSEGVIPCCKHFPGHGGIEIDSHVEAPRDTQSRADLERTSLVPFRTAIDNSVDMVMTAHVCYTALDHLAPASLSPRVVGDLVRGILGYTGVVITDDLDMGAVANHYTPEQACVRALQATTDLVLLCNKPENAFTSLDAVHNARSEGILPDELVRASRTRIERLLLRWNSSLQPCDLDAASAYFAAR